MENKMTKQLFLPSVVMIRHAQSQWNREGRFTGWANPPLTDAGREEARRAGQRLAERGHQFDAAYSSRLDRAIETAEIVLRESGNRSVPIITDWRLNERHYGALQGKDKVAMAAHVGDERVWRWRRGYLDQPPPAMRHDANHPSQDPAWSDIDAQILPNAESLADTRERVMQFWRAEIEPQLQQGKRLFIASHGNTLRALIMALQDMSIEQVENFEIPTGVPILYAFSAQGKPIGWHYLDDDNQRVA
jgi:2,3-bisphosphoglycerate-dependent phosphoglycerate mutase